jgi:hypothetical protein
VSDNKEIVLYMLHCGLDGRILQKICRQYGLQVRIHQFPREELFAYHMHGKRRSPDLILIRGHFIPLVHDLDQQRHIPYVVVSSKLKYGTGQPVFIHADQGYKDSPDTLALYHSIARTIKQMVEARVTEDGAEEDLNKEEAPDIQTEGSNHVKDRIP